MTYGASIGSRDLEGKRKYLLLICSYIFLMAIGARAVSFDSYSLFSQIKSLLSCELDVRAQSFFSIFLNVFIGRFIEFSVIFVSGLTAFGIPVACVQLGLCALKIGLISGGLYKIGGLAGFGCYALLFMPFALACAVIYIILTAQSCSFSSKLCKSIFIKPSINAPSDIKLYFQRSAVLFAFICCFAAIESAVGAFFGSMFADIC